MGFFDQLMLQLDEAVTGLIVTWNIYTSVLIVSLAAFLAYQIGARTDPDTHPFLLARQAQPSPVRHEGESPVYRSQAAPHSMPLNPGLNVRDPGVSKWAKGRDGDLRDIWRQAIAGVQEDGPFKGVTGRIFTVLGDSVTEHELESITRQINLIGQHVLEQGGNRVAIYLPNSVELIAALFACAFYNLTAIILPFNQSDEAVISMLRRSAADTVVTAPGSFPFDLVVKNYPPLRQLIWVVDEGSAHLDWNEVPQGTGSVVNVSTWQDIVSDYPVDAGKEPPPLGGQKEPRDVTIFWKSKPGTTEEMVKFTAANLISAVAAQTFAVPTLRRVDPSDLFLPADSLANTHTLVLTLAALYSNSSIAFNAAAVEATDLSIATRGISPTIVVATPAALLKTHQEAIGNLNSSVARNLYWALTRSLTQSGFMPADTVTSNYFNSFRPKIGKTPGKLRLIYTAERAGAGTPGLSSKVLSDLRVFTAARVIYALTAAKVAGAVTQTAFYDYRVFDDKTSHFGPPLTSTEIYLKDTPTAKNGDGVSRGEC
ncbi:hypothetical protein OQA88_6199 [Cercophora sp. LCS_1]